MRCRSCGQETAGLEVAPGGALPLCSPCLAEVRRTLGDATGMLKELGKVLGDLGVSADAGERLSEALPWTGERREAWDRLPEGDRLFINAAGHVSALFEDEPGLAFVDLPEPVLACIKRCSRAALFSAMGECLRLTLGDFNKLLHVMEIFGYEHFDYEDPPEPLGSFLEEGSGDDLLSVLFESLDMLLGTDGLRRIKEIRAWNLGGGVGPHPNQRYRSGAKDTDNESGGG